MTHDTDHCAERLAELYVQEFGGKQSGRYRISTKHVRALLGRRRVYEDDVESLRRALFERGFVLLDLDTFFVVLSAKTFVNYRRVNDEILEAD